MKILLPPIFHICNPFFVFYYNHTERRLLTISYLH